MPGVRFKKSPSPKCSPLSWRFSPQVTLLEERDVPASFYVDLNATAANPVFEQNRPDQFTGTFGVDVFNNVDAAITASNSTPGENAIYLANVPTTGTQSTFVISSAANTPVDITNSVNFIGEGAGSSVLQTDPTTNQSGAVLDIVGNGLVVNFTKVGFYGGALSYDTSGNVNPTNSDTGVFLNYEAGTTGTIDSGSFQGIFASGYGGFAVSASGGGTSVTVQNSSFSDIGHAGVNAEDDATVDLYGNTYNGRGAGPSVEYFAQIVGGATAVISGNTVTGIQGVATGGITSAAVLVAENGGVSSSAQIFGNAFNNDISGVIVGSGTTDTSTAVIRYNNFIGDFTGIGTSLAPGQGPIIGTNDYFGSSTGPYNSTTNPSGGGSGVSSDVTFAPVSLSSLPVVAAPTLESYQQQAFQNIATIAVGGVGNQPVYAVSNVTGKINAVPEQGYSSGSRVTLGDVTGDGIPDTIIGSGPGEASAVTIVNGATGKVFAQFPVLDGFTGGIFVAVGDFSHSGVDDIAVVADNGGGPRVQIWGFPNGNPTVLADFFAFPNISFRGGLRVAAGDLNGDGYADLMVTFGPGGGPILRTFNGQTLFTSQSLLYPDTYLFESGLRTGLFLAAGDFSGNGTVDVVATPASGGSPLARIYSGADLASAGASEVNAFYVGDPATRFGASVGARDVNFSGQAALFAGYGTGGSSQVRVYNSPLTASGQPNPDTSFDLYGSPNSGVYVG